LFQREILCGTEEQLARSKCTKINKTKSEARCAERITL